MAEGAVRPFWRGGLLRLVIPDVRSAFPDTCAYTLQIDAFKRTIADCGYTPHSQYGEPPCPKATRKAIGK